MDISSEGADRYWEVPEGHINKLAAAKCHMIPTTDRLLSQPLSLLESQDPEVEQHSRSNRMCWRRNRMENLSTLGKCLPLFLTSTIASIPVQI
jgi:hypothetical protein